MSSTEADRWRRMKIEERSTIPALASSASIRPHLAKTALKAAAWEAYEDTSALKNAALAPSRDAAKGRISCLVFHTDRLIGIPGLSRTDLGPCFLVDIKQGNSPTLFDQTRGKGCSHSRLWIICG